MAKLSVVVPIYEVEDYLEWCLDSLVAQTCTDIEVVCVNDGSTDGSRDIAARYVAADPRFVLIDKPNGGLSSARNAGIRAASAPLVCFVDSDDRLAPGACKRIVAAFDETGADIVTFGANCYPASAGNVWLAEHLSPRDVVYDGFAPDLVFKEMSQPFAWRTACKKDFLVDQGLFFREDVLFGEDTVFHFAIYPRARRTALISDKLYDYRVSRAGSLMHRVAGNPARKVAEHLKLIGWVFEDWEAGGFLRPCLAEMVAWTVEFVLLDIMRQPRPFRDGFAGDLRVSWLDHSSLEEILVLKLPWATKNLVRTVLLHPERLERTNSRRVLSYSYDVQQNGLFAVVGVLARRLADRVRERGNEQPCIHGQLQIGGLRFLEGEAGTTVWRFFVEWEGAKEASPEVSGLDGRGRPFDVETIPFEEQDLPGIASPDLVRKRLFLSVKLDEALQAFSLEATDALGNYRPGFFCVDRGVFERLRHEVSLHMLNAHEDDKNYQRWFAAHRAGEQDLREQGAHRFGYAPQVSIVVPCFKSTPAFLSDMVGSVMRQSYANWELLLLDASAETGVVRRAADAAGDERVRYVGLDGNKGIVGNTNRGIDEARGEFVAFLDHDDLLEPDALFEYVKCLNAHPGADLLFCDEDLFEHNGRFCRPVFKTRFNLDLLYSHNCVMHFLMVRTALLRAMEFSPDEVSGAQDYDLTLRVVEAGGEVCHVPRVLYHWRCHEALTGGDNLDSKPYAEEAGRGALEGHFARRGIAADVATTAHPFVYRVRYALPSPHPRVGIIIPSKDHADMLDACIRSIVEKSTYDNYRILVIENNSEEKATFSYYERIQEELPCVSVVAWEQGFNYSKIINFGVAQVDCPYFLLLNNDTLVISPGFIEEMLGYLQRPEVGVVGAKLYFRDGLVQHAGMLIGPGGTVTHVNQDFPPKREGYLSRAVRPGNFSAVTGACQMVKRSAFEAAGGYTEDFAVGFNDADFCLKVWQAGYRVVFSPYAELFHYEFTTRGREVADPAKQERWEKERALFQQRWPEYFDEGDPFTNPNLDRDSLYYALPRA